MLSVSNATNDARNWAMNSGRKCTVGCTQYQFQRVGDDKIFFSLFLYLIYFHLLLAVAFLYLTSFETNRSSGYWYWCRLAFTCQTKKMLSLIYSFAYCLPVSSCAHHADSLSHPNKLRADSELAYHAFNSTASMHIGCVRLDRFFPYWFRFIAHY